MTLILDFLNAHYFEGDQHYLFNYQDYLERRVALFSTFWSLKNPTFRAVVCVTTKTHDFSSFKVLNGVIIFHINKRKDVLSIKNSLHFPTKANAISFDIL